ncbi:MAG: glycosyltransferase family 39 protein, partial [Anaerolineae bacterium]|nr:glycosyltransferase family 39 protein [Anaerolineae bacterium]
GGWCVEKLRLRATAALSRLERLALQTGIGLGALALTALLLGLVGLFQPLLLWGFLAALTLLLRRQAVDWVRCGRALLGAARVRSGWEAFALVYLSAMLVMALIYGLAPPTHWDSLTYHLVAPTRYLREGRIAVQPDVFYLGFSQNVEMLYSYVVGAFGRASAAAPVHFGIGLLALLGLMGVTRRHAGRWAGWTAGLILLSSYNLWALFGWAYVDLGTLLYGALALIAITAWEESRAARWIVVMGGIAGLAAGVKYNAGALGLAMGGYVLLTQPRHALRHGALMAGAALIVFAPWALKGLALYGNPVYPFALGGLAWDAGRTAAFTFPDFSFSGRGWLWHLPILPFAATVFGQDNVDGYGFSLGMWLLTSFAALPLLWRWLLPRERALARAALIFIGALWTFWAAAGGSSGVGIQTRLMIMAFAAFAAAGGLAFVGLRRFPEKPIMIGFILRAIFIVTLLLTFYDAAHTLVRDRAAAYLFGEIAPEEYLYENTGAYANAMQHLPAGSQVRLMYEPRSLYCPESVRCLPDVLFDHWLRPRLAGNSAEAVFAAYRAAGDDYLLVFHTLYEQVLTVSRDRALDEAFMSALEAHMTPVWSDGVRYTLYGWKDE